MKWENAPRSHNVEVDCLGKRTKLDDSPEAQAALACQAALRELRDDKVDQLAGGGKPGQGIANIDEPRRALAEQHVEKAFTKDLNSFLELMGDDSKKGIVRKFVDHLFGASTYEGRLEMFKGYLEVPPLQELQPRPVRAGVQPTGHPQSDTTTSETARPGRVVIEHGRPGHANSGTVRDIPQSGRHK